MPVPLNAAAAISVQDVYKTFDGKNFVLNGINLSIPRGSITFIIGYSGTGKSVLLKHVLGLLRPTKGVVEVLGCDLASMSDADISTFRCKFGVLFQGSALFDDMNVIENVCFPLYEHRRDLTRDEALRIAQEKLALVEFEQLHYNKLPGELSGGMRKRVALARALALNPDILFYDEPTTGLDPIRTEMVDELILSTHRHREGITSVVVSHDLAAAFRIGDYVAMLDSGRVLLFGVPQDFLNSDIALVRRFVEKGLSRT